MAKLRSLSTAFWSDPFIEDLTPTQKLLFLYLITNEKTNMLGIYESSIKKIAFETGLNKKEVENGLKAFKKAGKVKYENNYIIVVNYLKHQNYNTNMKKSAIDVYNNLPSCLTDNKLTISKSKAEEGFERLLNHYVMVRKVEVEYEVEEEEEEETKKKKVSEFLERTYFEKSKLLDDAFKDYLKLRIVSKYTMTDRAINILVEKLRKLSEGNVKKAINIIERAILGNWKSFYDE